MRLILAFALCISTSVMMTPAHGLQFVADQVTRSGGHVHRGSLYYRDAMLRIAHNDPGSIEVTIVRKDKGVMWLLLGRTKQFATLPFDGSTGVRLERSMAQEIRRETVGTEILDGHPTTLFEITVEEGKEEGRRKVAPPLRFATQLSTDRILIAIRLSRSSQIIFAQFIV
jgi:hypothetical protein